MSEINWLDKVMEYKEDLLADLFDLIRIKSVREDDKATEEYPLGPGPVEALEAFMSLAERDGFKTKQFGPWAGRIEIGSGDEIFGILGHLDVVPVNDEWHTDPFEPVVKDGRIYARGSSDDKGPTMACYYALKILRDMGVEFNKEIHFVVGTDEESNWQDMDYYLQHAERPDFGFSPDAMFPIINGEKGNVSAIIKQAPEEATGEARLSLEAFESGLRPNMVAELAKATVSGDDLSELSNAFKVFIEASDLRGEVVERAEEKQVYLILRGVGAHGMVPERGRNAGTYLATFLKEYRFDQEVANRFIDLLAGPLHKHFDGSSVGANHHHEVMGDTSMNVGIMTYSKEEGSYIDVNFRYPLGITKEVIEANLQERLADYQASISLEGNKDPHYVPVDDPMVATLLDVYASQTGEAAYELSIGGGTFGRLMERGVAFGALFPDSEDVMHEPNEFIAIDDLMRATAIYCEAIYRLSR